MINHPANKQENSALVGDLERTGVHCIFRSPLMHRLDWTCIWEVSKSSVGSVYINLGPLELFISFHVINSSVQINYGQQKQSEYNIQTSQSRLFSFSGKSIYLLGWKYTLRMQDGKPRYRIFIKIQWNSVKGCKIKFPFLHQNIEFHSILYTRGTRGCWY